MSDKENKATKVVEEQKPKRNKYTVLKQFTADKVYLPGQNYLATKEVAEHLLRSKTIK